MENLEQLRRQIQSTESLLSVVRTMKALSMTSIRQCEQAVESLVDYYRTVRLGLQAALRQRPREVMLDGGKGARTGAVVFGAAWGMCGRFNETLAEHAADVLQQVDHPVHVCALGDRMAGLLADAGHPPERRHAPPDGVESITPRVQDVLVTIEQWRTGESVRRVFLFFNETTTGTAFEPATQQLLPLDERWLHQLEQEPWPTNQIPQFRTAWEPLFAALVRQYLFVSLYRAFAESLASEHSSRLAAMQVAQDSAEERLNTLQMRFNQRRQSAITEELLDITAGFEALSAEDGD